MNETASDGAPSACAYEPANGAIGRGFELDHVVDRRLARGKLGPRRLGKQDQINSALDVHPLDCPYASAAAQRLDVVVNQLPAPTTRTDRAASTRADTTICRLRLRAHQV